MEGAYCEEKSALRYDPNSNYNEDHVIWVGWLSHRCRSCETKTFTNKSSGTCCSGCHLGNLMLHFSHLENSQHIYFDPVNPERVREQIYVSRATTVTTFFDLCRYNAFTAIVLYSDIPKYFTWNNHFKKWKGRNFDVTIKGHPRIKMLFYWFHL